MNAEDEEYEFRKAEESFRRRHRRERIPKSSAELLSRLIAQRGFSQTQWNEQLQHHWQKAVGPELADKTKATMIKQGRLDVLVESSVAMQQLAFMKSSLLTMLQEQLPEAKILSIRFRVGQLN